MFDVGFWELLLIALVALMVFGPERLPRLVREATLWIRKARSVVASARSEINRELQLYELKQSMEEKRRRFESEINSLTVDASNLLAAPEKASDVSNGKEESHHEGT
jgi:sec-independent protein translocase protein TatB